MQKMKLTVVVCLCLVKLTVGGPLNISFRACDANLPDLDECLRQSSQEFFRELDKPAPDGTDPGLREPLRAQSLILGPGDELFAGRLALRDIETYGWAQTEFERATVTLSRQNFTVRGRSPSVTLKSQYRANGKILDRPLNEEGSLIAVFENILWEINANLEVIDRDGERYWRRYTSSLRAEPERLRLELGNQEDSLNTAISENWRNLYGELRGDFENILNAVLSRFIDKIYSQAPIKTFIINF